MARRLISLVGSRTSFTSDEEPHEGPILLGIDEAGRGATCGSLFVAGVWAEGFWVDDWHKHGLKESKKLSRSLRDDYAELIKDSCLKYHVVEITNHEIDQSNIDELELSAMIEIIREASADRVIIDCPAHRSRWLSWLEPEVGADHLILEHKADDRYPACAAASVIAKSTRDRHVDDLGLPCGGYFGKALYDRIRDDYERLGEVPPYVRRRWSNVRKILEPAEGLFDGQ